MTNKVKLELGYREDIDSVAEAALRLMDRVATLANNVANEEPSPVVGEEVFHAAMLVGDKLNVNTLDTDEQSFVVSVLNAALKRVNDARYEAGKERIARINAEANNKLDRLRECNKKLRERSEDLRQAKKRAKTELLIQQEKYDECVSSLKHVKTTATALRNMMGLPALDCSDSDYIANTLIALYNIASDCKVDLVKLRSQVIGD